MLLLAVLSFDCVSCTDLDPVSFCWASINVNRSWSLCGFWKTAIHQRSNLGQIHRRFNTQTKTDLVRFRHQNGIPCFSIKTFGFWLCADTVRIVCDALVINELASEKKSRIRQCAVQIGPNDVDQNWLNQGRRLEVASRRRRRTKQKEKRLNRPATRSDHTQFKACGCFGINEKKSRGESRSDKLPTSSFLSRHDRSSSILFWRCFIHWPSTKAYFFSRLVSLQLFIERLSDSITFDGAEGFFPMKLSVIASRIKPLARDCNK